MDESRMPSIDTVLFQFEMQTSHELKRDASHGYQARNRKWSFMDEP